MLIKYKTEPTITVLSPNSANLIKILTQFVYSINIRYFSPSSPVFCTAKYRGGVRRTEGLKKTEGVRIQAKATIPDSAFIGRRRRKEDGGKRARTV